MSRKIYTILSLLRQAARKQRKRPRSLPQQTRLPNRRQPMPLQRKRPLKKSLLPGGILQLTKVRRRSGNRWLIATWLNIQT